VFECNISSTAILYTLIESIVTIVASFEWKMEILRWYLILGFLVEVSAFIRLSFTTVPLRELLPVLSDDSLDAVPIMRRLYAWYVLTLGVLRLCTAMDMKHKYAFRALVVAHIMEAGFGVTEVLLHDPTYNQENMFASEHLKKTLFMALLVFQMLFIGSGYFRYVQVDEQTSKPSKKSN